MLLYRSSVGNGKTLRKDLGILEKDESSGPVILTDAAMDSQASTGVSGEWKDPYFSIYSQKTQRTPLSSTQLSLPESPVLFAVGVYLSHFR